MTLSIISNSGSPHENDVDVSFVIPCLNEEESISEVLREILAAKSLGVYSFEIVVADNGSTDRSAEIALDHGARVISVTDRGYGSALLGGIKAALGDIIVMADADGSYKFSESAPMIDAIKMGRADLVMGNRFLGGIAPGAMPWLHRWIGNPVLSFLGRLIYRVSIKDFHCGLRAFRRDSILGLDLKCTGMEFASEMIIKVSRSRLRIIEMPASLSPDLRSRPPHLRTWSDGFRHLKLLLRFSPVWIFAPILLVNLLSIVSLVYLGVLGPAVIAGRELSVRGLGTILSLSIVLIVVLYVLELARLISIGDWNKSPFVKFRKIILFLGLLVGVTSILGLWSQSINWIEEDFLLSSRLDGVMWFFFCLFGLSVSAISIVFLFLINVLKDNS